MSKLFPTNFRKDTGGVAHDTGVEKDVLRILVELPT